MLFDYALTIFITELKPLKEHFTLISISQINIKAVHPLGETQN
jgi:hypothetical protein